MSDVVGPLKPLPWQSAQWDTLIGQYNAQRMPHAIMLNGPEHVGKGAFARAAAHLMLCDSPMGGYACGHCKSCKLLAAGSHPDLMMLTPEEPGKALKIDQVRKLIDYVGKTSQQGGWKVAVIEPAEAMNVNASNALLKSLEEPTKNTLLILVCHMVSGVPPTIRSRCRLTTFGLPSEAESVSWLQRQLPEGAESPNWLLTQASGRPLLAKNLASSDLLDQKREFHEVLDGVAQGALSAVVAAEKCYRHKGVERIDWMSQRVIERVKGEPGADQTRVWFKFQDRLNGVKRELQSSANPNPQLLWESLLFDWQALHGRRV